MTDNELTSQDVAFLELLASPPTVDLVLDDILNGFSVERAREVLDSPEKLNHLLTIVAQVAPGLGWKLASSGTTEASRLNAQLLFAALQHRAETADIDTPLVTQLDELTTIVPGRLAAADRALLAHVALPDGDLWWDPLNLDEPPIVAYQGDAPRWVAEVGPQSAGQHPLGRYALGRWLFRWHPGTGQHHNPFDEPLLRLELGVLAWQNASHLGSTEAATHWLRDSGTTLLMLVNRVQHWTGWRRELADDLLAPAADAYLATQPDSGPAAAIRDLADRLRHAETLVQLSGIDQLRPADFSATPEAAELALVAGESSNQVIAQGLVTIDPRCVPPRSIARRQMQAMWEVVDGPHPELHVLVVAGETPVEMLQAQLVADGVESVLELRRTGSLYSGNVQLEQLPDRLDVQIVHPEHGRDSRPANQREDFIADIESIIETRQEIYLDLTDLSVDCTVLVDRPFLAELVAWDAEL